jgi:hypothetical protein
MDLRRDGQRGFKERREEKNLHHEGIEGGKGRELGCMTRRTQRDTISGHSTAFVKFVSIMCYGLCDLLLIKVDNKYEYKLMLSLC